MKTGPVRATIVLTEMQRGRVERAELSPASRTRSQRLQELVELGLQVAERAPAMRNRLGDEYLKSVGLGGGV